MEMLECLEEDGCQLLVVDLRVELTRMEVICDFLLKVME